MPEPVQAVAIPDARGLTDPEAHPAAQAIVNLFRPWNVTDAEACGLLGGLPRHSWSRWKTGKIGPISRDLGALLSLYLGIHSALRLIFGNNQQRLYGWMRRANLAFGGASALGVIRNGQILDLCRVRQYLDRACADYKAIQAESHLLQGLQN